MSVNLQDWNNMLKRVVTTHSQSEHPYICITEVDGEERKIEVGRWKVDFRGQTLSSEVPQVISRFVNPRGERLLPFQW